MTPAGPRILTAAMFLSSFAWSFVFVSLPFHVQAISTEGPAATLRWTGWILGVSSLATVVAAPLWGRLGSRRDPVALYALVDLLQGVMFFAMAVARTLPELFVVRLVLGVMGAASTFAFLVAGRAADPAEVRRSVAAIQSAMTVGQVVGPLAGAVAAARIGFRPSFVVGGLILLGCAGVVRWTLGGARSPAPAVVRSRPAPRRDVAVVAAVVLGGSTQIFFFTAILPEVLPGLGVDAAGTLEVGGVLIFVTGVAAALGAMAAPRLAEVAGERRLIGALLLASSAFLAALGLAGSAWTYGVLRFLQVLCIAPVFPLVVARIAASAGGGAIGVINSARIGGSFIGPVAATSVLAVAPAWLLYLVLAATGAGCALLIRLRPR